MNISLPKCSEEQHEVIQNLKNSNVLVDSVAGSGKTTTSLHIAKNYMDQKILLLTYNANLKIDTRQKVITHNISNMEVHSFHSFCVKYYNRNCYNDSVMKKMMNSILKPLNNFDYDIIIVDELQDLTILYYRLLCQIYKDNQVFNKKSAKICILGDKCQSIYQFNDADARFIIRGDTLFNFNNLSWKKTNLSYSFRITHEMAKFINKCMLKSDRIKSEKVTPNKPKYIICDCFKPAVIFEEVKYFLDKGYKPSDIFILAPSVKKGKQPIRMLENEIKGTLKDIPIYVPTCDEEKVDNDVIEGKMVFSTFHQVKGLERKVVIVFNFDDSYFKFYGDRRDLYRNVLSGWSIGMKFNIIK